MTSSISQNPIVCPCSGTRREQIVTRFRDGLDTLEALSSATGVCSGCGGCEFDVQELIDGLTALRSGPLPFKKIP